MSGLAGRRVLLTREAADCAAWAAEIEGLGAVPVILPCIECRDLDTPDLRARLAAELPRARWAAFTSRRGVAEFARLHGGAGQEPPPDAGRAPGPGPGPGPDPASAGPEPGPLPVPAARPDGPPNRPPDRLPGAPAEAPAATLPDGLRVAAVGPATARAAADTFGRVDLVGDGGGADAAHAAADPARGAGAAASLAEALAPRLGPRDRVLLAVAENAGPAFEETIRSAGHACIRLDVYRTLPAPGRPRKRAASDLGVDAVLLASPSAVTGFMNRVRLDTAPGIFTIGPATTEAARAAGVEVTGEAPRPSLGGLLEAMRCAT